MRTFFCFREWREKRRAKNSGGRAREDGEVEGGSVARATAPSLPLPKTLEQRRVKCRERKRKPIPPKKKNRGIRFSGRRSIKRTQLGIYGLRVYFIGRLTISRYRILPA